MVETPLTNGLCCPLIALMTSSGADAISERNGLSFADMLSPFCSTNISIKDPLGNYVKSKLFLDVRDIKKNGFLLSHTVLPHILRENLLLRPSSADEDDIFSSCFSDFFMYWFEPADHDFLRSYICCVFVVSVGDVNPLEELNQLQYQQHLQQHGHSDQAFSGLAHCASPKWMLPNILKYYVLIQDSSLHDTERAKSIFNEMVSKYGALHCHLLRINSTSYSEMPDPWSRVMEQRYRGLQRGLERARRAILEKTEVFQEVENKNQYIPASITRSFTSSFASLNQQQHPNLLFTTSTASSPHALLNNARSLSPNGVEFNSRLQNLSLSNTSAETDSDQKSTTIYGQCLDAGDRERLQTMLEEFVRNALLPFVEHQLALQNETLSNRRTIGRSLNNMRKWLSAASTTPTANTSVCYTNESSECQTRCLADMAFQFGLYSFAHQLYQALKKDFANDQAWLYHAGTLEMAAFTSFLSFMSLQSVSQSAAQTLRSSSQLSPALLSQIQRTYPQRYMDNAINYYLNVCLQPMLALRCVLISVHILSRIQLYTEAANHLIQLNACNLPDLYSAILLEHAAGLFEKAGKRRRMVFYMVLAGHRYVKAELPRLALRCYCKALPLLQDRRWCFAEDHLLYTLITQCEEQQQLKSDLPNGDDNGTIKSDEFLVELAAKLLRFGERQVAEQQRVYLFQYVRLLRRFVNAPTLLLVPAVDLSSTKVFYGDAHGLSRALYAASYAANSSTSRYTLYSPPPEDFRPPADGFVGIALDIVGANSLLVWEELEQCALRSFKADAPHEQVETHKLFSDERTGNEHSSNVSPSLEPITVELTLRNPLGVSLTLRNLRLGVTAKVDADETNDGGSLLEKSIIDELILRSSEESDGLAKNNLVTVSLSVVPSTSMTSLIIDRLEYGLHLPSFGSNNQPVYVDGFIPLKIRGRRLFSTKKQRLNKTYAEDYRLHASISAKKWPLLQFQTNSGKQGHVNAYCNQMYQVIMEVENVGAVDIEHLCMLTNRHELVSLSERGRPSAAEAKEDGRLSSTGHQWTLCDSEWHAPSAQLTAATGSDGILMHKVSAVSRSAPCRSGNKMSLRLAFRTPAQPVTDHQVVVLFWYVGANGVARQFRYQLTLSTQPLLAAALVPLNVADGLCALQLRNLISNHDSILAKIELQRLSLIVLAASERSSLTCVSNSASSSNNLSKQHNSKSLRLRNVSRRYATDCRLMDIGIRPLANNKPVVLESEQSQNYCFRLNGVRDLESGGVDASFLSSSSEVWISDYVADIPEWSHLLPASEFSVPSPLPPSAAETSSSVGQLSVQTNQDTDLFYHLRFAVLWRASIANSDGMVATVFGENILANPFINIADDHRLSPSRGAISCEAANNISASPASIPGSPLLFLATHNEMAEAAMLNRRNACQQSTSSSASAHNKNLTDHDGHEAGGFQSRPNPFVMSPPGGYGVRQVPPARTAAAQQFAASSFSPSSSSAQMF